MASREVPQNIEAERALLGAIFFRPTVVHAVMARLKTSDPFLDSHHRSVYDAMEVLARRPDVPIDPITVADEMGRRGYHLTESLALCTRLATSMGQAENVEHYLRIVLEQHQNRRLIGAWAEFAPVLYEGSDSDLDLDERKAAFAQEVFSIVNETGEDFSTRAAISKLLSDIEDRGRAGGDAMLGVSTGLSKLDALLGGGLQRKHFIVVAARPGVGKSALAINGFAVEAAIVNDIPTLVFSLEMSREDLFERVLAAMTRIDVAMIHRGNIDYENQRKMTDAGIRIANAPLLIDATPGLTIAQIQARARRFRADPRYFPPPPLVAPGEPAPPDPLGLVIVDYLQRARGIGGPRQGRQDEVAQISRGLADLAKQINLPVVGLSQLNRELEKTPGDKRPRLSHLRESGGIEQDADEVIMIHRAELDPTDKSATPGLAELLLRKARHGAMGVMAASFIGALARFENYHRDYEPHVAPYSDD